MAMSSNVKGLLAGTAVGVAGAAVAWATVAPPVVWVAVLAASVVTGWVVRAGAVRTKARTDAEGTGTAIVTATLVHLARCDGPLTEGERRAILVEGEKATRILVPWAPERHSVAAWLGFCEDLDLSEYRAALLDVLERDSVTADRVIRHCVAVALADGPLTADELRWLDAMGVITGTDGRGWTVADRVTPEGVPARPTPTHG